MNTYELAKRALYDITDVPIPEHMEDALMSDDATVHLGAALEQVSYADASGADRKALPYDELESAFRSRAYHVLTRTPEGKGTDSPDERLRADINPEGDK